MGWFCRRHCRGRQGSKDRKKRGGTSGSKIAEFANKEVCEGDKFRQVVGRDQMLQNYVGDGKISDFISSN